MDPQVGGLYKLFSHSELIPNLLMAYTTFTDAVACPPQSDEAIVGMQNGCICCTLQSDLVDQIIKLTEMKRFNYILIEASGVSEPHEIAPLFDIEEPHEV